MLFTVTTANDDENGALGGTSLREAINAANSTPGADTIKFNNNLSNATITLTKGQLQIKSDLTISGNGITISGNNKNRVLLVDNGAGSRANVTLDNLKIIRGNDIGGGIFNQENLTVTNSTISGNSGSGGAGIYNNQGSLRVVNSTLSGNNCSFRGGALYNKVPTNQLVVINSTISGNTAVAGASLFTYGISTFVNSTINGNKANFGGGIENFGKLSLVNTTLSGNSAGTLGGGISHRGGTIDIFNSTITQNSAPTGFGSGISGDAGAAGRTITLVNTIVAGNVSTDLDRINGNNAIFTSNGSNIIGTGNQLSVFNKTGDQRGVTNPGLGPLANNGGSTFTHALLATSVAIDAGDNSKLPPDTYDLNGNKNTTEPLPLDETGKPRVLGGIVDIGAFEFVSPLISIGDISIAEGNTGTKNANFLVTLDKPTSKKVSLVYSTSNGTAVAPGDYKAITNQTLVFQPNQTTATIAIAIVFDTTFEPNETFSINLTNAIHGTLNKAVATGTIINDDLKPKISIGDRTITEGNSGTTSAQFVVTLSNPSYQAISATYQTANGTAVAPSDYITGSGQISFAPGQTSRTISVQVRGDTLVEQNETFRVNLSNFNNVDAGKISALGVIRNDDLQGKSLINHRDILSLCSTTPLTSRDTSLLRESIPLGDVLTPSHSII